MSSDTVPRWPRIDAIVREDGSGEVTIDGTFHPITTGSLEEARVEVLRRVTENAAMVGRPVRASATGPEGLWNLIVHPDGTVVPEEDEIEPQPSPAQSSPMPAPAFDGVPVADLPPAGEPTAADPIAGAGSAGAVGSDALGSAVEVDPDDTVRRAPRAPEVPDVAPSPADGAVPPGASADVADRVRENAAESLPGSATGNLSGSVANHVPGLVTAVPPAGNGGSGSLSAPPSGPVQGTEDGPRSRREARQSFLTHQQDEDPATRGFRGMLTRLGLRVGPSESERAERADERAVSQHWPGPRTISIVNGKGGAGKTPSTVLLAAVFAQFGGAGVVTWDNNQTRGTLGWRTEQGPHESTLLDLLPQTDRLLGPSAQAADLARYVHHQTRDRFDVLRSKPIAMANEQRIKPQDVDAIHSVLSKYYRMIFIDSGNDESDPMWQRMIDLTDQLVVATTTRDDHAEAGALLLEALATRDGRSAYLAQQAVVVVSQADQKESLSELEKVADGYRSLAREVVTIPFDPAMVDGHLRYGALRQETRRAWLGAGAAVAGGL
jgi:MinD-like ATPase involved in chromosome partitioning or flagellar assembly